MSSSLLKCFLFLLLVANVSFGQKDEAPGTIYNLKNSPDPDDNKLSLNFAPLPLLSFPYSSVQFGAEVKLYNNISGAIQAGFFSPTSQVNGYIIRPEIKLYLNSSGQASGDYCAIDFMYKKESYNYTDSILLTPAYVKTFPENKTVYYFDIKYGEVIIGGNVIVVDVFFGLGVRVKRVTSNLTPQEVSHMDFTPPGETDPSDIDGGTYEIGNFIYPNIEAGITIGFKIK
jgi:hypothetical protein